MPNPPLRSLDQAGHIPHDRRLIESNEQEFAVEADLLDEIQCLVEAS
jgi:hypothetical protein